MNSIRVKTSPLFSPIVGTIALLVIIAIATVILLSRDKGPAPGEVYVRAGLPDSSLVAHIYTTLPPMAADLMVAILAFDREIKIDQVGDCEDIVNEYNQAGEVAAIPVFLPAQNRCFSYQIRFDLTAPESGQMFPLTLALVHPDEDIDLLSDPE